MANAPSAAREPVEVRDFNSPPQERMCVIYLKDEYVDTEGNPKSIALKWNTGKPSPASIPVATKVTLHAGKQYRTNLFRAEAWFGKFTIPVLMQDVLDERRREGMTELFESEKRRAIMAWGEFPRGQATERGNGGAEIGPARIPPVVLTVEEADGATWDAIDLRELYALGEYWDVDTKPKQFVKPGPQPLDEVAALKLQIAELQGAIAAFGSLIRKDNMSSASPQPAESVVDHPRGKKE